MDEADVEEFDKFVERNWGKQKVSVPVSAEIEARKNTDLESETAKGRGRPKKA